MEFSAVPEEPSSEVHDETPGFLLIICFFIVVLRLGLILSRLASNSFSSFLYLSSPGTTWLIKVFLLGSLKLWLCKPWESTHSLGQRRKVESQTMAASQDEQSRRQWQKDLGKIDQRVKTQWKQRNKTGSLLSRATQKPCGRMGVHWANTSVHCLCVWGGVVSAYQC